MSVRHKQTRNVSSSSRFFAPFEVAFGRFGCTSFRRCPFLWAPWPWLKALCRPLFLGRCRGTTEVIMMTLSQFVPDSGKTVMRKRCSEPMCFEFCWCLVSPNAEVTMDSIASIYVAGSEDMTGGYLICIIQSLAYDLVRHVLMIWAPSPMDCAVFQPQSIQSLVYSMCYWPHVGTQNPLVLAVSCSCIDWSVPYTFQALSLRWDPFDQKEVGTQSLLHCLGHHCSLAFVGCPSCPSCPKDLCPWY